MEPYPIERSPDFKPAIGIGGGSFTNTFRFRIVMKKNSFNEYALLPARFIRTAGDLACQIDQGYVEISPGDLIVEGSGYLPVSPANNRVYLKARRVLVIKEDHGIALVKEIPIRLTDIPQSVITGAGVYHNRDGSFFSGGDQ